MHTRFDVVSSRMKHGEFVCQLDFARPLISTDGLAKPLNFSVLVRMVIATCVRCVMRQNIASLSTKTFLKSPLIQDIIEKSRSGASIALSVRELLFTPMQTAWPSFHEDVQTSMDQLSETRGIAQFQSTVRPNSK